MNNLLSQAQNGLQIAPSGGFKGFGMLGLEKGSAADAPLIFNKFLTTVVGVITVIAFIWFVIQFFTGAIALMTSGGDKNKLSEAKAKITTSFIGLVVVIAAIFIIEVVGRIFGIPWILNPAVLIYQFANQ